MTITRGGQIWPAANLPERTAFDERISGTMDIVRLKGDMVNHPPHYTSHPSGVECIDITKHMGFTLGNALKYIWRADLKENKEEDLKKAIWYIEKELEGLNNAKSETT